MKNPATARYALPTTRTHKASNTQSTPPTSPSDFIPQLPTSHPKPQRNINRASRQRQRPPISPRPLPMQIIHIITDDTTRTWTTRQDSQTQDPKTHPNPRTNLRLILGQHGETNGREGHKNTREETQHYSLHDESSQRLHGHHA